MFTIIYLLGMLFMIIATLAFPSLPYLNLTKESVIISPFLHIGLFVKAHQLLFSLTHLLALVVASFTKIIDDEKVEYAGATIRTAGYLYTLLGMTAALLYLNAEENKAAYYLASAAGTSLIPSIIGYFLGNAIENHNRPSKRDYMDELQKINETLQDSCASEKLALQEIKQMLQHSCASEKLALQEINQTLQYSCDSEELALQEIKQTLQDSFASEEFAKAHNTYIDMLVEIMEQAAIAIERSFKKINAATNESRRIAEARDGELSDDPEPNVDEFADMPVFDLSDRTKKSLRRSKHM